MPPKCWKLIFGDAVNNGSRARAGVARLEGNLALYLLPAGESPEADGLISGELVFETQQLQKKTKLRPAEARKLPHHRSIDSFDVFRSFWTFSARLFFSKSFGRRC